MAYFLFKCWHEKLFYLNSDNVRFIQADLPVTMIEITRDNVNLVKDLRGIEYVEQFKKQLSLGDFGYYAFADNKPVGYGWVKHVGSDDFFYEIEEGCAYLCRFFVHETVRGHNIYPEIISTLIKREQDIKHFYIGVERGNISSEKGLSKTGFKFVKEYGFVRGFKHTFNKKLLRCKV